MTERQSRICDGPTCGIELSTGGTRNGFISAHIMYFEVGPHHITYPSDEPGQAYDKNGNEWVAPPWRFHKPDEVDFCSWACFVGWASAHIFSEG